MLIISPRFVSRLRDKYSAKLTELLITGKLVWRSRRTGAILARSADDLLADSPHLQCRIERRLEVQRSRQSV